MSRNEASAAQALAAEDHSTNPWTTLPRARSIQYFNLRAAARALPAAATRDAFLDLYHKHQVIIVNGETGAGKTTQVPQFVLYDDHRGIVCTQTRRLAASEMATRVAQELDVELGREVGYVFRHEDGTGSRTLISFTTDGHLFQEMKKDQSLTKYDCIIIDEAHERTVRTDLLLMLLRQLCERRPDLKLIIMSATMNSRKFQNYFGGAPIHHIPGRTYPVEVFHVADERLGGRNFVTSPVVDYVVAAVNTVVQIHKEGRRGDVLVFMPGQEDVDNTVAGIQRECSLMEVFGLYANMSKALQRQALKPLGEGKQNFRKCIMATNIAETSLTINGIVYVDCGLERSMTYNPRIRMEMLLVAPTPQAFVLQRTGRAGRTQPGKCFRLYSEHDFENTLVKTPLPEIQRCEMAGSIVDIMALQRDPRVNAIFTAPYIDPPAPEVMMSPSPAWEVAAIVSLLSEDRLFLRAGPDSSFSDVVRAHFHHPDGDHLTLLNIWNAYYFQVANVCRDKRPSDRLEHLRQWCQEHFLDSEIMRLAWKTFAELLQFCEREMQLRGDLLPASSASWASPQFSLVIRKTLLRGGFLKIAVRETVGDGFRTLGEHQSGLIHPDSALVSREHDFVMYDSYMRTKKCYFINVTGIDSQWLFEDAMASVYVNSLLNNYISSSEKWFPIKQLKIVKAEFDRRHASAQ
ncbi:hypothetical protein VSDG_02350 [Cytospora chrysosperma]|uniref:RNA helicase n=1 Tax=Cytospora chrysosperma TaxID=252740 RepID=A0A423WG18_CYTCH|nr:hypothetical protein VSDG_02350 [Valsa sordida]